MLHAALTIAGSDPCGGAGIQADLKTFHQFGVYGEAVITLITVQNTVEMSRVECLDPELVAAQIRAVVGDIRPAAAKTGALGNSGIIEAVPPRIEAVCPIGSGDALAAAFAWSRARGDDFADALRWGVAAGTASALLPGLQFADFARTKEMFERVEVRASE